MNINSPVIELTKLAPRYQKTLKYLGVFSIKDLLLYFPRRHMDFSSFSKIKDLKPETVVTIVGKVKSIQKRFSFKSRKGLAEAVISDDTGSIRATWFNQGYIASLYKPGDTIALSGKVSLYRNLQLANPVHEKVTQENIHTGRLVPIYRLPETMNNRAFRQLMKSALPYAEQIQEILPKTILDKYLIPSMTETINEMHFPTNISQLQKARTRLVFEEVFVEQVAVALHKRELMSLPAYSVKPKIQFIKSVLKTLPFTLTLTQRSALWQILQDIETKHPMNRLLEGDVGSGKTLVAFLSMLEIAKAGFQSALMAPTEILALQHFENLVKLINNLKTKTFKPALLTRSFIQTSDEKLKPQELKNKIKKGEVNLIIGTHALLNTSQNFKKLALVIIDEQHRFGVKQRSVLLKSNENEPVPHLLSMSATPIPRTLALTLYGDLEISRLTEIPANRIPIKTEIVSEEKRPEAYEFVKKHLKEGRQAFIVTPLVEESENLEVKSVKAEFERLSSEVFLGFKLGLLYGTMKSSDKEKIMTEFSEGKIQILVSTSVVEVGVDVPNASIMIIEGAERFGLAQLHQLRGRVGRGKHASFCFLFTSSGTETETPRLQEFSKTLDGFSLAEIDLEQRGFGSLFGSTQSGFNFKFSEFLTIRTLKIAQEACKDLFLLEKSEENYPEIFAKARPKIENLHLE